jgi:hypothetical protein
MEAQPATFARQSIEETFDGRAIAGPVGPNQDLAAVAE